MNNIVGQVTTSNELPIVYDLVKEILGDDIISLDQFQSMHAKNSNISHNIKKNGAIAGFLSLSFLTASAFKDLQKKRLTTMELTGEHQVEDGTKPAAMYVGGIGAVADKDVRKYTVEYRDKICDEYRQCNIPILSRPTTEAGMRIARKRNYLPLHGQGGLGQLYISP